MVFNSQPCPLLHRSDVNPITKCTQDAEDERERARYNIVSMREIKEPVHWQRRANVFNEALMGNMHG